MYHFSVFMGIKSTWSRNQSPLSNRGFIEDLITGIYLHVARSKLIFCYKENFSVGEVEKPSVIFVLEQK